MKTSPTTLALLIAGSVLAATHAAEVDLTKLPPPSAQKDLTFDTHIKPIFAESCVDCHGPKKQKAKLRLDSLKAVLQGAGKTKVVLPGQSQKSRLVHLVARLVKNDAMPPQDSADPLTKEQVGLIRAWIDQGAK